jgi:hypothetical protein
VVSSHSATDFLNDVRNFNKSRHRAALSFFRYFATASEEFFISNLYTHYPLLSNTHLFEFLKTPPYPALPNQSKHILKRIE